MAPSMKYDATQAAQASEEQARVNITVVVCTYNRAPILREALDSLAASSVATSVNWEILVVDNNSTDGTRRVVDKCSEQNPGRFRYFFESQQGLSFARNAGIREARGEVVAFSDDDVKVEPNWLQNLTAEVLTGNYAGAGGRIFPEWTSPRPAWLPVQDRYGLAPLTSFDLGPTPIDLTEPPVGANMAFRKSMFEKYGHFRTDLGRRPGTLIGDEEIEFGNRLLKGGERLRYEPSAVVHHPVQEARVKREYFLAWWFDKARAEILQDGVPQSRWRICGIPLYLFRRAAVWTLRWMFAVRPAQRFSRKTKLWSVAGGILECYRQSDYSRVRYAAQPSSTQ